MKKLLFILAPFVLAGCDATNSNSSESASAPKLAPVSAVTQVQQTVYQWQDVQPAGVEQATINKSSHEYWQTVSGRELMAGVEVYLTTEENFIRLAPKASFENGEVYKAQGLDLDQLELAGPSKKGHTLSQKANQKEMNLAGFADGSVAISAATKGQNTIIKSTQALQADAAYLIHVVEKNSPIALDVESGFKKSQSQDNLQLDLQIAGSKVSDGEVVVSLISPVDEDVNVAFANDQVEFDQPLSQLGAINGFYEIEATVTKEINGKLVKRSLKVPFTNVLHTASLGQHKFEKEASMGLATVYANIPIDVVMPGQYAVKATLVSRIGDTDIPLATVEAAQKLDYSGTIQLPFQFPDMPEGQLLLTDIEVTDQSRMIKMYQK